MLTAIAFLAGKAYEEPTVHEFEAYDRSFKMFISVRAVKRGTVRSESNVAENGG